MQKKLPIKLAPAFRYGADTPWGGNKLREAFGMNAPSPVTGEALIASVLRGLESVSEGGAKLSDIAPDFPLLIKIIDARERLSVQVHPDDAFARANENKLGKTEAWVVLSAEPNSSMVYGLVKDADTLERAIRSGSESDVMACLNVVPVRTGDVFYIGAGTVHALGAGVVVYEIQQSSDVTYRLYDYGRARELHIDKGLACVRRAKHSDCVKDADTIDSPFFTLKRLRVDGTFSIEEADKPRVLTPLCEGELTCDQTKLEFGLCESVFIPAGCARVLVRAHGELLLAGV